MTDAPAEGSKFDLIALERTKFGLRLLGCADLLFALAVLLRIELAAAVVFGAGLAVLVLATVVSAPTPHGPFPPFLRAIYVCIWIGRLVLDVWYGPEPFEWREPTWVYVCEGVAAWAFVSLPVVLWRFCQHRGLTGQGLLWLWIAMAYVAFALLGVLWPPAAWAFPAIHFCQFVVAQRTARAVWLDAINRHARHFARTEPAPEVEPLRPAH